MQAIKLSNEIGSSKAAFETIPIFAMTANTFVAGKKRCRDAGISGYIAKPIDVEAIAAMLEDNT